MTSGLQKKRKKNHLILSQHIKETIGRLILVNTNNFFSLFNEPNEQ